MTNEWEIQFKLEGSERSENFRFLVSPIKDFKREFPNFPKDKLLRALELHHEKGNYKFHRGYLKEVKIQKNSELNEKQEIHVLMLVFEKVGPISLIFRQSFQYLILEGIDANYNYLGSEILVDVLIQIIKPDSPAPRGLGKIKAVYHSSNIEELAKKVDYIPVLDTMEGQVILFSLSVILPTLLIIILPSSVLDSMITYLITLGVISILICIFPITKRSLKYTPLALVSALTTHLIIELLLHFNILIDGRNPWGIFNNISRQNLLGLLKQQDLVQSLRPEIFIGIEVLNVTIPFIDVIFIALIPFTIGVGLIGAIEKKERKGKSAVIVRMLFAILMIIFIAIIPITYHAVGKGTEGTLFASLGLLETAEMFSPKFTEDLIINEKELIELIQSAQMHLYKASNSFEQFGQNPLIVYILPFIFPEVAGIPLKDLPKILTLTNVFADSVPYYRNLIWAYYDLALGFNLSFQILQESMEKSQVTGIGTTTLQNYDQEMIEALKIIEDGFSNLTYTEQPLLELINSVQETLDYSVFSEISNFLEEIELGLPLLIIAVSGSIPWINSTYKTTLALDDLYNFNFNPDILKMAEKDYNDSLMIQSIDISSLEQQQDSLMPILDIIKFIRNLHKTTRYLLHSTQNASLMFQSLNQTLSLFQNINFENSTNIYDPIWDDIDQGLQNTSKYLMATHISLDKMNETITSQELIEFEQLTQLNQFLEELIDFTESTSDKFDIVDDYFSALEKTLDAIRYYSLGTNCLNMTFTSALENKTIIEFDYDEVYTQANTNFTLCQESSNATYQILSGVTDHFLNETSITNWRNLIKGDLGNPDTNSVYMNANKCKNLITTVRLRSDISIVTLNDLLEFKTILIRMNELDWDIFVL